MKPSNKKGIRYENIKKYCKSFLIFLFASMILCACDKKEDVNNEALDIQEELIEESTESNLVEEEELEEEQDEEAVKLNDKYFPRYKI